MATVTRLEEARWRRKDPRQLMATELRRFSPPVTGAERKKLSVEYGLRAEALEAAAEDVILFDTESMLLGLARRYRELSEYLAEDTPAA